jgi:hypothetical protein
LAATQHESIPTKLAYKALSDKAASLNTPSSVISEEKMLA